MLTCPELPKQLSTIAILRALASLFTEKKKITYLKIAVRYKSLTSKESERQANNDSDIPRNYFR